MQIKGYYTTDEAAAKLNVHRESLLRAVRTGSCPLTAYEMKAPRCRRKYFFKKDAVDRASASSWFTRSTNGS